MFYPVDSLRRGGRFYLCWVADSWPLRFATITHRQLWSQDIRKICDDLLEVMTNESGRPSRRFSLRLSAQLTRGLVRLYQRKVTIFLGELCMLNANVTKHVNKKFVYHEEVRIVTNTLPPAVVEVVQEAPENEERVEEMIRMSGNVVANIDEITLKESALPEVQLLLNDNFGELHPEQGLQLVDKTLEQMLAPDQSAPHTSVELPLDWSTDRSHDRSRLAAHDLQMERISEHDLTLFRKSVGVEPLQILDVTKEIPGIPENPEILPPAVPDPQPEMGEKEITEIVMETEQDIPEVTNAEKKQEEPVEVVLEELEEMQRPAKRRRLKSKIIDKQTKLTSNYFRARIGNCAVELRCEDASEDIASITVPAPSLLGRAARAAGHTLTRLFLRNLGPVSGRPLIEKEMEEVMAPRVTRSHFRSELDKIVEGAEPALDERQVEPPADPVPGRPVPEVVLPDDIAELPTQVIETLSQQKRKQTADPDNEGTRTPKAPRRSNCRSIKCTRPEQPQTPYVEPVPDYEGNKENISDNLPQEAVQPSDMDQLAVLSSMLQQAGLADLPPPPPRAASDRTDTPLGSLDRTKVSLGDSDKTTDSTRFLREQWGTASTMVRIVEGLREGARPLDVRALLARGPVVPGLENFAAARCFTSILKLKQHRFIKICKDPETLEIRDISFGDKFDNM